MWTRRSNTNFVDIKDSFLDWRLKKPGYKYFKKDGAILKQHSSGIDLIYFDEDTILDDNIDFNLIIGNGLLDKNLGSQYHFGVKPLLNKNIMPADVTNMMILSDIF